MRTKREQTRKGLIQVMPGLVKEERPAIGLQTLQLDAKRDALLYVPASYETGRQAPLAVMLHGAGGDAHHGMSLLQPLADATGMLLLAPPSRGSTWDVIEERSFGSDVLFITAAIEHVLSRYTVDMNRLAIGGFSDGASYALCLGLINGHLFTHVLSFSPGFYVAPEPQGKPRVYISHGVHDHILPIAHCSRRIVPQLQKQQYNVLYQEFDGEHVLPEQICNAAVHWFLEAG